MGNDLFRDPKFIVLTGNYGSGKTEIALHLAETFAEKQKTTLVDLDIVNPYFRSGEKAEELQERGIRVLMPTFALTTVDIPALPAEIQSVFESDAEKVIFDVGGDDTGAAALGRYFPFFMKNRDRTLVALVVNCLRPLTEEPADIIDLAQRIQARGRLKLDALINNTNLAHQTTGVMLRDAADKVRESAKALSVEKVIHCATQETLSAMGVSESLNGRAVLHTGHEFVQGIFPEEILTIRRRMIPEWMQD